ncbi:MAG TPA: 2-phosphosulfolactate phosphatase [Tenuifilaceae bacterium]|mgnify:CR=1 FL=1|nr:2-phosphosulfolactate phosphatase [Tenuifilaceae bacterium]HPE18085.1 2-phosphosulfolactate phosphatase [Tenuifilaceae bacterium]HPJ45455.1 2-phosphosulfolactate phosphatase [Tenuifilaceae bacterium]HPQ34072.1 2-phosphosulfolactate phosphatase [Tenuifilaceae bacterium]HRX68033.1 2-phosphosulfolactate phosphatase [Tenuifilaceae bacterium]
MEKRQIEVCFSPELFRFYKNENAHVVVIDILRATSAICAAFANGAEAIIPVPTIDEAREYKKKGYMVAAERDGVTLDFADFGNSPFNFTPERVMGKTVAYSTTNGTQAITQASVGLNVIIASFLNLSAVSNWLMNQPNGDVLFLCAGWKGRYCTEDSLLAGAIAQKLLESNLFETKCDATYSSIDLWNVAKIDIFLYLERIAQRHRLKRLGLDDVLEYCFTPDSCNKVPFLKDGVIVTE